MNDHSITTKALLGDARNMAFRGAASLGRFVGRRCLDRAATMEKLHQLGCEPDNHGIFRLNSGGSRIDIDILNCGVVRVGGRDCLDLDYGSRGVLRGWKGGSANADHAVALWSHRWMGYYHWIIDIAPKIAAIQELSPPDAQRQWIFPRSGQPYESETLEMLGVPEANIIDSLHHRAIRVDSVEMMALPGWFEIQQASAMLRDRLLPFGGPSGGERIFLKRRGRRSCVNEDEVVRFLATKGFDMVEDEPRSVTAQIGIFKHAKVIVAPHGAALSNLLWCSAESHIIECFAEGYSPPYYENLAAFRGMTYKCIGKTSNSHWTGVERDVWIDINELAERLDQIGIL